MNEQDFSRRDLLRLAGVGGGVVFASTLPGCAGMAQGTRDFHFVQLSDIHWGYNNAAMALGSVPLKSGLTDALL